MNEISSESDEYFLVQLSIHLLNLAELSKKSTVNLTSFMTLLVGSNFNEILLHERFK